MPVINSPRDYQQEAIDKVFERWDNGYQNVLLVAPTGAGKCLGKDTPVLMFDGSVKAVQDVEVGDQLMGTDSTPRNVLSLATGQEMLYRVTPVKGDSYVVNESHILSLKTTGDKSLEKGSIVNISVKEYLQKSKWFKHIHKGWRTGVEFKTKHLDEYLPPYLLGVWLGDGNSRTSCITTADHEIVDYINEYASHHEQDVRVEDQTNNKSKNYHVTNKRLRNSPSFRQSLKHWKLLENKHIPHEYKTSSRNQRLNLLAGILDSDGHLSKKYYDIVFKNRVLAYDVTFLARSLGFAAYVKPCRKTCTNNGATGDYYRITISGDVSLIPTKLNRHQPEPREQKKSVLVTGIKVEPIGVGNFYGFEIDGDRLFMLGDFTVTHNTIVKGFAAKYFQTINRFSVSNPDKFVVIFAHRDVLLDQISLAAAKIGLTHQLMCSKATEREIGNAHVREFGYSFVDAHHQSKIIIASVPTWVKRDVDALAPHVGLWLMDETHHVLADNQWGRAIKPIEHALGLGVTATPMRADGKYLGRGAKSEGVFDTMIDEYELPSLSMENLIATGSLSPYRIFHTPDRIDTGQVRISKSGDFNRDDLAQATDKIGITGDAVDQYRKHADGKRAIIFAVNIAHSDHVAEQFSKAGYSAVSLSSKTPIAYRQKMINQFKSGQIQILVNCDLFGEGFDVPAVEVVIMLRKTLSYGLFMQMFGRMLRVMEGKTHGILIDHVGNVREHCSTRRPHKAPKWLLDRPLNEPGRRRKIQEEDDDEPDIFTRTCPECFCYYEPDSKHPDSFICPDCGHSETQQEVNQAAIEVHAKEIDLIEYDTSYLDGIIKERNKINYDVGTAIERAKYAGLTGAALKRRANDHLAKQESQRVLREWINSWCHHMQHQYGYELEVVRKEFHRIFDVNIYDASVLSARHASELTDKIKLNWSNYITIQI